MLNKNDGAKIAVSFVTTKSLHHFLYFISSSYYLLSRNILRHCWHHQILPSPPTISSCSLYQVSTGTCDTQVPVPVTSVAQVEAVAHLTYLIGSVSAKEERIVRHVEEVLAVVVDDVDALVGGLRESLRRLHIGLHPLVLLL